MTVEENSVTEVPPIKLVRSTGRARIETRPAGMKFDLVDADAEHHTGTTPADLENIPIGTGRIIFTPEAGPEHWQEIRISRNKTVAANWQREMPSRPSVAPAAALEAAKPAPAPPAPASTASPESTFKNSLGRAMVWIPTLRIWVSETETTQGEFRSLMGSNPSENAGPDDLPVDCVTQTQAMEFCARLSQKEAGALPANYVYTLPTDSQWSIYSGDASLKDAVTSDSSPRRGPARVKVLAQIITASTHSRQSLGMDAHALHSISQYRRGPSGVHSP